MEFDYSGVKMKKKKIKITDVQREFNRAIVRRDKMCKVRDNYSSCAGSLQCSHFYTVGGNSALRFFPCNAHTQCAGHHIRHHHHDPLFYARYMQAQHAEDLQLMERLRGKVCRYSQDVLERIFDFSKNDELKKLQNYIIELLEGEE